MIEVGLQLAARCGALQLEREAAQVASAQSDQLQVLLDRSGQELGKTCRKRLAALVGVVAPVRRAENAERVRFVRPDQVKQVQRGLFGGLEPELAAIGGGQDGMQLRVFGRGDI